MDSFIRMLLIAGGCIMPLVSCKEQKKENDAARPEAFPPPAKLESSRAPKTEEASAAKAPEPPKTAAALPPASQTPASRDAARKEAMERFNKVTNSSSPAPQREGQP